MMRARTPLLITTGLLAALVLAGCTSTPDAAPSVAASATATDLPAPDADTSATPTTAPIDPTCENIIPKSTVDDFKSLGWTSQEEPFRIGATALDDGIQCKWGDAKVASDRVQIFGWAPSTTRPRSRRRKTSSPPAGSWSATPPAITSPRTPTGSAVAVPTATA